MVQKARLSFVTDGPRCHAPGVRWWRQSCAPTRPAGEDDVRPMDVTGKQVMRWRGRVFVLLLFATGATANPLATTDGVRYCLGTYEMDIYWRTPPKRQLSSVRVHTQLIRSRWLRWRPGWTSGLRRARLMPGSRFGQNGRRTTGPISGLPGGNPQTGLGA